MYQESIVEEDSQIKVELEMLFTDRSTSVNII